MSRRSERLDWLLSLEPADRHARLRKLKESGKRELRYHWRLWAATAQLAPPGDWSIWLIMAGRGFGKTRAGAEWLREVADHDPHARIALVGATLNEVRAVMVEGESGIMSISPRDRRPRFEPSLRRLTWPNGASAWLYSALEPESLRGPQHSHAWCDELAKWENIGGKAEKVWDNLLLGLRLGERPRVLVTTTPRATPLLRRVLAQEGLVLTKGRSEDNADNLPPRFLSAMRRTYGRTALGRQELDGELIEDIAGALWSRGLIEQCRESGAPADHARIVIGVDPPATATGDACGIVVTALGADGIARVLADASVRKPSPEKWARAVANAAQAWRADRVVAEANQGGAMVESVLRAADLSLPVKLVRASKGKSARAEPVAALYEAGRVRHAGTFPQLEDELCGLIAGGAYQGPGRSPDRADALVWAMTELMLGRGGLPRVRTDL